MLYITEDLHNGEIGPILTMSYLKTSWGLRKPSKTPFYVKPLGNPNDVGDVLLNHPLI